MREVDRLLVEELHIDLIQLMENAGRNLADLAQRLYAPDGALVLAGPGGNGGGGLVAARHLANRGVQVVVVLAVDEPRFAPTPFRQLDILRRMGVPMVQWPHEQGIDVVIDALIGYGLRGTPHGRTAELIGWANAQAAPVLSLDNPSGLDVTTGAAPAACIQAHATLTLALPKVGLLASSKIGRLYLADISVPPLTYRRLGLAVGHPFATHPVIELDDTGQPR